MAWIPALCERLFFFHLGMTHVTVERWEQVKDAVDLHRERLDFADALHWVASAGCTRLVTFDDRRFAPSQAGATIA